MASSKGAESESEKTDGDVSASGVRVERETTPAPAGASEEWAAMPSMRPTRVPAYDVAAHAFESTVRHRALPGLPLDVAIPMRTSAPAPDDLELRAAYLLLHVDGRSSVREIADLTGLPVEEVLTAFLSLVAGGLLDLGSARSLHPPPLSGARNKTDPDPDR